MSNHNKGEIKTWNEGKPNIVGSSGALGLIGGIAGRAVKMLNFANIRSAVKQYVGKGGAKTQQSLQSLSPRTASGGGSRPLIINNKVVKSYTPKKGTNPGSKPGRPPHEIYHTTKPKPPATSVDNWGRPGLPKLTNEYGKVLGKGDLMRRGIRPGAHGGYQVKYKTGLDAAGKQRHGWRYTHPFAVDK